MFELQKEFVLGFLVQFFTEIYEPLGRFKNKQIQRNDIPQELNIFSSNREMISKLKRKSRDIHFEVYSFGN